MWPYVYALYPIYVAQVTRDSAFAVRRPGECRYFVDPGCEVALTKPAFTPKDVEVRPRSGFSSFGVGLFVAGRGGVGPSRFK